MKQYIQKEITAIKLIRQRILKIGEVSAQEALLKAKLYYCDIRPGR